MELHDGNDSSGLSLLLVLACLPVAALVGAAAGSARTASAEAIEGAGRNAQDAVAALNLNAEAGRYARAYAGVVGLAVQVLDPALGPSGADDVRDYEDLAGEFDVVIEVDVQHVEANSSGRANLPIAIHSEALLRIVEPGTGRVVQAFRIRRESDARNADEWLADSGAALRGELYAQAREFGERAVDAYMMMYDPAAGSAQEGQSAGNLPGYTVRATYPPIRRDSVGFHPFKDLGCGKKYQCDPAAGGLERFRLETLTPEFRWELLPRDFSFAARSAIDSGHAVRYDFRLFDRDGIVYERIGLHEPSHVPDHPLEACTEYRWTARARFMMPATVRATEWLGAYEVVTGRGLLPWWSAGITGQGVAFAVPDHGLIFYPPVLTPGLEGARCRRY